MITILTVASLVPVGFGAYKVIKGLLDLRNARRMQDTATSKVRSVAIGFAELEGVARADEVLTAPLSGRPCVYYHCEIERCRLSGGETRSKEWFSYLREEKHVPFSIEDGTGSIALRTEQAEFNCAPDKRWYLRPGSSFTMERWRDHKGTLVELETEAHEIPPTNGGARRLGSYRFTERIIAPGDPTYVIGTVKREDDVFMGLDRRLGPFVISDRHEERFVHTLRTSAIASIVLGSILVIIGGLLVWFSTLEP